jgi:small subunit ribosomal protein S3
MGHKTHPLGFRLGITQEHKSEWYSKLNDYSKYIKEDYMIRNVIYQYLEKERIRPSGVTKIIVRRTTNNKQINVEISTALPGLLVGKAGSGLKMMDKRFLYLFPNKKIIMNVLEIKNIYHYADLVAELVVEQLENRIPFRRAMKTIIAKTQETNIKGIKIQIAGRVNGAEIARTEWLREGRVPLQTMRADIDFSYKTAQTIYGILGIKIWLFKGDILITE